ncbi:hypothetical protein JTB14_025260 [Gonioctena quinquepunctata]|nr:hypothetical protein JTB14_025260 [Gonioctena quinquepunctata]
MLQYIFSKFHTTEIYDVNRRFRDLGEEVYPNYDEHKTYLVRCIKHQQLLRRVVGNINKVFSSILFLQLGGSILLVCSSLYGLSKELFSSSDSSVYDSDEDPPYYPESSDSGVKPNFDERKQGRLLAKLSPMTVDSRSPLVKSESFCMENQCREGDEVRFERKRESMEKGKEKEFPKNKKWDCKNHKGKGDRTMSYCNEFVNQEIEQCDEAEISSQKNEVENIIPSGSLKLFCRNSVLNEETESSSKKSKSKFVRKPDFCFYCETKVSNFATHIERNHLSEHEVQKILSKPTNCAERKQLFTSLRKQGNYPFNATESFKPMRTSLSPNTIVLSV